MTDLARTVFDLNEATIRSYIHRFNRDGVAGLRTTYGTGRPPTLAWTQSPLAGCPRPITPAHLSLLATKAHNWTQALLRQYLKAYHQIEVSRTDDCRESAPSRHPLAACQVTSLFT